MAVFQPVSKAGADRRIAENINSGAPLAELREEGPVHTVVRAVVRGKLCIGNIRDAGDSEVTKQSCIAVGDNMR